MGTAYLAVLITLGYYVFAFDPEKDPADPASTVGSTWSANPIDKFFLGALRRVVGRVSPRWVGKAGALEEMETAFNQVGSNGTRKAKGVYRAVHANSPPVLHTTV